MGLEMRTGHSEWVFGLGADRGCDQEELQTDADCGSCQSSFAHMTAHLWQHC